MRTKSKFTTFILSFIPGLGHIYLGFNTRGGIFMIAEMIAAALAILMENTDIFGGGSSTAIPLCLIPVVWIASLVDSLTLVDKINDIAICNSEEKKDILLEQLEQQNKKTIAMVLSIIPGAGHMFLGLQRQGLQLMAIFFLSFFITDWINLSIFMPLIPIIWFFGLFDAMNKAAGNDKRDDSDVLFVNWFRNGKPLVKNANKYLAYALIAIGCLLLAEKIIFPELEKFIRFNFREYFRVIILSVLFIIGGVKMLMGTENEETMKAGEDEL
ncbi:hypothetical protein [Acetivibrio clariflavus]|uniref:TM2 domain-containing protein n=1 Tax=Acetivibrio clariflavus (strain DSM 19732 / NBRC 101661 / EBR45) TaxID=720554 RepID=G8LTX7_ACECE|nr:hypothetical protein [Acetivibrio clariflavus]AEV67323.1 TM2 domain-containing protein [Acetivibrio clariflavus DSM 19732]